MKKFTILFSFALLFVCASTLFAQGWYNTSWHYRKKITIDHTKVPNTDQSSFPVLVSLSADAGLSAHALSSGNDILFTSSDGTTKINYQRESYSSGTLVAWVSVATLSHTADNVLYMYYGNSGASDQQAATSTWDANYKAVWHLDEATGTNAADATSNGRTGTQSGSPTQASGEIGGSLTFGTNKYLDMGNVADFNFGTGAFTISCWLFSGSDSKFIIGKDDFTGNNNGVLIYTKTSATLGYAYWPGGVVGNIYFGAKGSAWHYCVVTRTGTGASGVVSYYDGSPVTTSSEPRTLSNTTPFRIGQDNITNTYAFDGSVDEVRISNSVRSADWIKTEYNNQSSPSTFYTIAAEVATYVWNQTSSASWATTTNWTPTRTTPATNDVLQFNGGGTLPVTSVPTQTISQLLISNSSTVNLTAASTGNTLTVNDALTTTASDVLSFGTEVLGGTLTTLTNSGKIQTAVLTSTSATPIPASKTWGGTVEYNGSGAQTAVGGTYSTLKINNSTGVTLAAASTVTTLTIGDVTSSSIFSDGGFVITPGASSVLNLTSGTYNLGSAGTATTWPAWTTRNITAGTTIGYVSAVSQAISITPSYPNLTLSGASTKTPDAGTLTVGGNLTVSAGTLALNTNSNTVNVTGNITNSGTITAGTAEAISVSGNWTNTGGTYTKGTETVTFNGSSDATFTGATTFNNVTLNKGAANKLTLANDLTVGSTLTLTAGYISTSTNQVNVTNTAAGAVAATNGIINGKITRAMLAGTGSGTFLFNDASTSITANGTNPTSLTFQSFPNTSPTYGTSPSTNAIKRYYTITATGGSASRTLSLSYRNAAGGLDVSEVNSLTESTLSLWEGNGTTTWTDIGGTRSTTSNPPNSAYASGSTSSFSDWTLSQHNGPLPVELVSFTANSNGKEVELNWRTATEVNNYGFEVQRSAVGGQQSVWEKIGFVQGHGNSNSPKEYSFVDNNSQPGKIQYRLKQIDFDGQFKYSNVVEVVNEAPANFVLNQNYPNPFNPTTNITYSLPQNSFVVIKVYDMLGREVKTLVNNEMTSGTHTAEWKGDNNNGNLVASGTYIYRISAGSFSSIKKMLLMK